MTWYVDQRHAWIAEMLHIYGHINRRHIVAKFGCSVLTASHDLTGFADKNAAWVKYDTRRKAYINLKFMETPRKTPDAKRIHVSASLKSMTHSRPDQQGYPRGLARGCEAQGRAAATDHRGPVPGLNIACGQSRPDRQADNPPNPGGTMAAPIQKQYRQQMSDLARAPQLHHQWQSQRHDRDVA